MSPLKNKISVVSQLNMRACLVKQVLDFLGFRSFTLVGNKQAYIQHCRSSANQVKTIAGLTRDWPKTGDLTMTTPLSVKLQHNFNIWFVSNTEILVLSKMTENWFKICSRCVTFRQSIWKFNVGSQRSDHMNNFKIIDHHKHQEWHIVQSCWLSSSERMQEEECPIMFTLLVPKWQLLFANECHPILLSALRRRCTLKYRLYCCVFTYAQ